MGWDDTRYFTIASQATVYWLLFWRHKHMVFVGFLLAFTKGTMAIAWPSWYPFLHMRKIRQEKHADAHTILHWQIIHTDHPFRFGCEWQHTCSLWLGEFHALFVCYSCLCAVSLYVIIRLATGTQSCCLYDEPSTWNEYEYGYPFTKLRTYHRVYMDDRILTLYTLVSTCLSRVNWLDPQIDRIN